MAFFLRFTETPELDLQTGMSGHWNDEGEKEDLAGLCGFELNAEDLEQALEEVEGFYYNSTYSMSSFGDNWAIYKGVYRDSVPDGQVFLAQEIVYQPK